MAILIKDREADQLIRTLAERGIAIPRGSVIYTIQRRVYTEGTMGVFIKNPATEAKIRQLAARTGESLTAIDHAVDERLERLGPLKRKERVNRKKLAGLLAYFDSLPKVNENLTNEEIVGYDESALAR